METEALYQVVKRMVPLEVEAWNAFNAQLTFRRLKKHELLWDTGDVCREVGFITKGLMRYFFNHEDEEITGQFFLRTLLLRIMPVSSRQKVRSWHSKRLRKLNC